MAGKLLYMSRPEVGKVDLPMVEIIGAMEGIFRKKGAGRTEMSPEIGIYLGHDDFLRAMPAYMPTSRSAGIKRLKAEGCILEGEDR